VIFNSLCRELAEFIKLNTKTEEEEVSLTRLIGSTVDLRIKGYTVRVFIDVIHLLVTCDVDSKKLATSCP